MIGVEIKNGFIDFSNIKFKCPNCNKKYEDVNDKYLKRCEKNKSGITKIRCGCNKSFSMTYNYMGDAVSF